MITTYLNINKNGCYKKNSSKQLMVMVVTTYHYNIKKCEHIDGNLLIYLFEIL
jgi:hypothetical protein